MCVCLYLDVYVSYRAGGRFHFIIPRPQKKVYKNHSLQVAYKIEFGPPIELGPLIPPPIEFGPPYPFIGGFFRGGGIPSSPLRTRQIF